MSSVAVVIPFQNFDQGLVDAISSALNQNHDSLYLMLIQNNRTDDIIEERHYDEYKKNQRIFYHNLETCLNANVARDFGAREAIKKGFEYIAFLDSDDVWQLNHVSDCLDVFSRHHCDVVFTSFCVNNGSDKYFFNNKPSNDILYDLFIKKTIDCRSSCLVVTSKAYLQVPFDVNLKKHQDWGYVVDSSSVLKVFISEMQTVIINVSLRDRMSNSVNPRLSLDFATSRLIEPYYSNFLFSRLIEAIQFESIDAYNLLYPRILASNLTLKRRFYYLLMPFFTFFNSTVIKFYRSFFTGNNK